MATISTGAKGKGRRVDHDIPLIPFIDCLLCLISFLLITAVWQEMGRVAASTDVPGKASATEPEQRRTLHVELRADDAFELVWRRGDVVLDSEVVDARGEQLQGATRYAALGERIAQRWERTDERHHAAWDREVDRAVLHTPNSTPFEHIVAIMDAIHTPHRDFRDAAGDVVRRPAYDVVFAIN